MFPVFTGGTMPQAEGIYPQHTIDKYLILAVFLILWDAGFSP